MHDNNPMTIYIAKLQDLVNEMKSLGEAIVLDYLGREGWLEACRVSSVSKSLCESLLMPRLNSCFPFCVIFLLHLGCSMQLLP